MRSIRIILLILFVWCGLLAVLILLSETPWETLRAIRPLLLGPVLFLLLMVLLARRRGGRTIASVLDEGVNKGLFGTRRIALTHEGVTESGDFGTSQTPWSTVERIAFDQNYAFIYTSAISAVLVPKRAFAEEGQFEEFMETAQRFLAAKDSS